MGGHDLEGTLSLSEFQTILVEPDIAVFLNDVGVDMLVLVDMAEMIYEDIAKEYDGLDFQHFVEAMLNMRGTNPVTVQDVKSQLRIMKRMIKDSVTALEENIGKSYHKMGKKIRKVKKVVQGDVEDL